MSSYIKRFVVFLFLWGFILFGSQYIIFFQFNNWPKLLIASFVLSLAFAWMYRYMERRSIPRREKKITDRLREIFDAEKVEGNILKTELEGVDLFMVIGAQKNAEVAFYFTKEDYKIHVDNNDHQVVQELILDREMMKIYQTNSWMLKRALKKIKTLIQETGK